MSRPVPSPSMKGMMGRSGTSKTPLVYAMVWPSRGTRMPLYVCFMGVYLALVGAQRPGRQRRRRATRPARTRHHSIIQRRDAAVCVRGATDGCATNLWVSAVPDRAPLPEFLPAAAHLAAAQCDDGVGTPDGPVHPRSLESLSDNRLTACLDHARTNK